MDPFFKAQHKRYAPTMENGYLEDLARTYKVGGPLPERRSETYERALEFRRKEKEAHQAMIGERDSYRDELARTTNALNQLSAQFTDLTTKLSKMKTIDGSSDQSSVSGSRHPAADSSVPDNDSVTDSQQRGENVSGAVPE